jgi:hypothetical protein
MAGLGITELALEILARDGHFTVGNGVALEQCQSFASSTLWLP